MFGIISNCVHFNQNYGIECAFHFNVLQRDTKISLMQFLIEFWIALWKSTSRKLIWLILKKYRIGWPKSIDDQAKIAGSLPILPIFLKEDVAKIGGAKKVEEELTCWISTMMAPCERKKSALKNSDAERVSFIYILKPLSRLIRGNLNSRHLQNSGLVSAGN